MKFEKNAKYNTYALLALIVVAFAALLVSIVYNADSVKSFFSELLSVLSPLIYAFLLSLVLSPIADFFDVKFLKLFKKAKKPEKKARVFAIICTYLLFALVLTLVVLILVSQSTKAYGFAANFADEYMPLLNDFVADVSERFDFLGDRLETLVNALNESLSAWISNIPSLAMSVFGALGSIISFFSNWLLAIIISIYALFRREKLKALCRKANTALFSEKVSEGMSAFFGSLYRNMVCFYSARAYNMVAVAIAYYLVLMIMGLEFYSLIALIIAVCSFVPVIGNLIGGAIGAFLVLVTDTDVLLRYIIVFIVLTFMDYLYLRPIITNKRVRVSLGTTIICVFVGFFLGDIAGALFALPLYATLREFFVLWNRKKKTKNGTVKNSAV